MNERLHNLLDGNLSEQENAELFALPEDKLEFQEHQQLQEALRQNGAGNSLTSGEKVAMKAALAAAIGLESPMPAAAGQAQQPVQSAIQTSAGTSWYLKAFAALLLGIALGAGLFALFDREEKSVQTIGIAVESTVPSAIPFGLLGSGAGDNCDETVQQLRDSLRMMEEKSTKRRPKKAIPWWKKGPPAVPGD